MRVIDGVGVFVVVVVLMMLMMMKGIGCGLVSRVSLKITLFNLYDFITADRH